MTPEVSSPAASDRYFDATVNTLRQVVATQAGVIRSAAHLLAEAVMTDKSIFSFGASHSFMITEELVYRSGGLMLINPIYPQGMNLFVRPLTATSQRERVPGLGRELLESSPARPGDVLLITSTSGRNPVAIDMAVRAMELSIKTIAITSLAYSAAEKSRHASGKKLAGICDIVIDNCAPHGDACLKINGLPQKTGPLSTITGCAIANAIVCETVELLVQKGVAPPVFMSANLEGGEERNAELLAKNRCRIHYL